jgi:hypothetical protein
MISNTILYIIFGSTLGLFFLISIVIGSFILYYRIYNYKWELLKEVAGIGTIPSRKGRCKLVGFGKGGTKIFYIPYLKRYESASKFTGRNKITWAESIDGTWTDVVFSNVDKVRKEIGINPMDRNTRLANASARKMFDDEYTDKSLLSKLALPITLFLLFIIIVGFGISQYYVAKKNTEMVVNNLEVSKTNKEVANLNLEVVKTLKGENSGISEQNSGLIRNG